MFGLIFRLLSQGFSVAIPIFASYKALKSSDPVTLKVWVKYWIVFATIFLIEPFVDILSPGLFFYDEFKFFFKLWLVLPRFNGSTMLYGNYIEPFLMQNEQNIESWLTDFEGQLSKSKSYYLKLLISLLPETVQQNLPNLSWLYSDNQDQSQELNFGNIPTNQSGVDGIRNPVIDASVRLGQGLVYNLKDSLQLWLSNTGNGGKSTNENDTYTNVLNQITSQFSTGSDKPTPSATSTSNPMDQLAELNTQRENLQAILQQVNNKAKEISTNSSKALPLNNNYFKGISFISTDPVIGKTESLTVSSGSSSSSDTEFDYVRDEDIVVEANKIEVATTSTSPKLTNSQDMRRGWFSWRSTTNSGLTEQNVKDQAKPE
ncbi:hypothetical protein NADFUDRAFT_80238 [Nadsonia fulvescens var. elongata DSM 6958]|uniref:Protein YOP1 n=1 Tax=Nadsonia fulvescens var. elongata DSM 6958 TaxID=857566 RepID=A0A1E3PFC7_9ASCO|nr:hypothetical protein NADFUDRAFT_80238 [Nadsonia fulvescens var. elongata DSM 6958]